MEIAPFSCAHIESFLSSARQEEWITGRREIEFLLSSYPEGCLVVLDAGQPTAFVTTIRYGKSAWIGNLLVLPERRGRGIGRSLMEKVLAGLDGAACETVWLTASAAGAPLYRTLGFAQIDRVQRWQGSGWAARGGGQPGCSREMSRIDSLGWGDKRSTLLESLPGNCSCFVAKNGFLVYSPLSSVSQIGPWGAVSPEAAAVLLENALLADHSAPAVCLDIPEQNQRAGELISAQGFSVTGRTLLMYRGRKPEYRAEHIFALASMGSYG